VNDVINPETGAAADLAWFEAVVTKADAGDRAALAALRRTLDANPEVWKKVGDLAGHAEAAWVDLAAGGNRLVAESLRREADRLRDALRGERPTPAERLLADQVVVSYLEVGYLRAQAAASPGATQGQVKAGLKRLESAQRRYLDAVKALETVRKLAGAGSAARLKVFAAAGG
jgi:hypothetical protein